MDEILKLFSSSVPSDWWKALAFIFAGAFLLLLWRLIKAFISFAKKWFEKQEQDHIEMQKDIVDIKDGMREFKDDLKDLVAVNKMHEWRISAAERDVRELRGKPSVDYE